ncbi:DUF92 domain-containing protein [Mucilaginibacter aquatilis]|uniref:DUF92 domain-containing protein n=1 Tax=Mucilaginibacter aquatilis TaxID=1517760 RepID=A0A6I4I9K0_9SPHI|nr:DUF92 domain-containing protein [Mucilaginibacter aquatilis]MVN91880.1 DUF92 domain-containing protein [Mucilaginibacter aquatilis]
MLLQYSALLIFLISGTVLSIYFKKLTPLAALTGLLCALAVFAGAGYTGVAIMTAFFVIATIATTWKRNVKQQLNTIAANDALRKSSQVIANAGVAALAGLLSVFLYPNSIIWPLIIAAAFSAACGDTVSSELGTVYGKKFFNILTFEPDETGLDGVVSLEGTLLGVIGSLIIAAIYFIGYHSLHGAVIVAVCGVFGNLSDSFLGALFERKGLLKNDAVNFLNTLAAALLATFISF